MYLSRVRKSKLEGFEYFVNNPIAKSLSTRLVSEQLCKSLREAPCKDFRCSTGILP